MSLRGRLLVAIAALLAVGLVSADVATFGFLRSTLIRRVDQQLIGGADPAFQQLRDIAGVSGPGGGGMFHGGEHGGGVAYAQWFDGSGATIAQHSFAFDYEAPRPALPPGVVTKTYPEPVFLSTGSVGGSLHYRVLVASLTERFTNRAGGTLVVAYPLTDVDETLRHLLIVEGFVTGGVVGAAVLLALWLVRIGMRPLEQMERTAEQIAGGALSSRIEHVDPRTEVGRLGRALNVMLERIEQAFAQRAQSEARLRRFIADASHELRTPLTSIRGYAELFRHGADKRPEDLRKTMRRIEEESMRMGTLVDELLLLARLDQGRPLERGSVDLSRIVDDAAADARAVDQERVIDAWTPGPVTVEGDEARLRQVVANLVSNALVHTPPATPVHLRLHATQAEAVIEVADDGPGIEADDQAKVFDRFYRVDTSRARGDNHDVGSGLGLSIVAAIAHAHGGRVWLQSSPGNGAAFFVALPLSAPAGREAAEAGATS